MTDLRSDLERLGERAAPRTDAFERLERRRRRKERNRRMGAAAVALVLVLGGSLAAYTVVRDETPATVGGDTIPEVAELTCDGEGMVSAASSTVTAQPEGVHLAITNVGSTPVVFSVVGLGGDGVEPGERKETVWQSAPGELGVSCEAEPLDAGGAPSSTVLTIVDPNGYFVPSALECASGEGYGSAPAYEEGATGFAGDPVQVVRDHVSGLEYDMQVERAGYPESAEPAIRIVRGDTVIGRVTLFDDGQGGWLPSAIEGCGGTLFGWSEEPTGVSGPPGPAPDLQDLCAGTYADEGRYRGTDLVVTGENIAFDTPCLVVPGGEPFTISFRNLDAGVPRNVSIYAMEPCLRERILLGAPASATCSAAKSVYEGEIVVGAAEIVYRVPRLEPGEYYFQDDVHPSAGGVLVVEFTP
ncbi:MAG TPA: hypothetical protein VFK59_01235 [Actinomycetota bacterium]|nr:hypothetical protein [Actinomycetota bacterium]